MSRYFVVGDIHGKAQMLEELMTEWDGKAQLVFLGDLIMFMTLTYFQLFDISLVGAVGC